MTAILETSGSYLYLLNGERAPVTETWHRAIDAHGKLVTGSNRLAGDVEISVEAVGSIDRVERFDVVWSQSRIVQVSATYQIQADGIAVSRKHLNQPEEKCFLEDAPGTSLLFPLMRIFSGPIIQSLHRQGGEGDVVLPDIRNPEAVESLLQPIQSRRSTVLLDESDIITRGQLELACARFQYLGELYDERASFWIDSDGLLARYRWQQDEKQEWDVWLVHDQNTEKPV